MRIAYVCADQGVPVFGAKGASVHVRELCRALERLGHEVLVVSPRLGDRRPAGFTPAVVELPVDPDDEAACSLLAADGAGGPAAAREVRALLYAASLRRALPGLLRTFGADVVYERYALHGTAGGAAARALGVPHLLEVNAPLSAEQAAHRGLRFAGLARGLERGILQGADRVIAVSRGVRDWLVRSGVAPERAVVLANAVDVDAFALPADERAATRVRLGLGLCPAVGFVGTLKPWHDVATLVRAVALLARAGMEIRLVVIGEGPERAALEGLARVQGVEAATRFVGSVPHDAVPRYLAALDAGVVPYAASPSFYFSPLKLFEYLAAAVPVVAADVGDIRHCVRPGATGALYRPGDPLALAEALLEVLLDPARSARIGAAGRAHVRAHHTWNGNAEAVVALAEQSATGGKQVVACA
ncbi:MAG TPA: glycosyltransferase [Gaiellaceae bacterium]|nr:glycosyltransferase [Gaiellaceae bacterium]